MSAQATPALAGPAAPARQVRWTVGLVLCASFVVFADVSVLTLVAPVIERGLRASVSDLELMVAGYQAAYAVTLITGGRLGDIYGRRAMFSVGFLGFVAASAACGFATTAGQLITFRVIQGVTGALLTPQVLATIQLVVPPERRAGAFAALGAVLSLSSILGPLIAGLVVAADIDGYTWRPVFLVNVPIGLAAVALAQRLVPNARSPEATRVDSAGTAFAVLMLAALMIPLTTAPAFGWPMWSVLSLAAVPAVGWLFLWSQRRQAAAGRPPLLPPSLWADRRFRKGLLLYALLFSGIVGFYIYYALVMESAYRLSALATAVSTIPSAGAALVVSAVSGVFVRRWGARRVLAAGAVVSGIGFGSVIAPVAMVKSPALAAWTLPSQLCLGVGLGLVIAPALSVVLAGIRGADVGAASGLLSTVQQLGAAIGVMLMGLLFESQIPHAFGSATPVQLSAGFEYALLFEPAAFGFAVYLMFRMSRTGPGPRSGPRLEAS